MILKNPITDITRLANSIHTTRDILRARLQAIAKSLPQIPEEAIDQAVWLTDSAHYGRVELSVSSLGLVIRHTQPQAQYWRWENVPTYLLAPAAQKVEELLTKLREALAATEKEEVALVRRL